MKKIKLTFIVFIVILVILVVQGKAEDMVVDPYYGGYSIVFKCELPNGTIIDVVSFDTIYDKYYDNKLGRELNVAFDNNQSLKCNFKPHKG